MAELLELLRLLTGLQHLIYPGLSYITTLLYHLIYHNLAFWPSSQTQNEISDLILGLILSFLSNKWPRVVLDGKSSQDYPGNARVPGSFILGPTVFLLYINDLSDNFIR